jgi:hypothetical protein
VSPVECAWHSAGRVGESLFTNQLEVKVVAAGARREKACALAPSQSYRFVNKVGMGGRCAAGVGGDRAPPSGGADPGGKKCRISQGEVAGGGSAFSLIWRDEWLIFQHSQECWNGEGGGWWSEGDDGESG